MLNQIQKSKIKNLNNLKRFAKFENRRCLKKYRITDQQKRILATTVKLMEEIGELSDKVLANDNIQRKEKIDKQKKKELLGEFGDVIIVTLLLADLMDVDVEEALKITIDKIYKRYKK